MKADEFAFHVPRIRSRHLIALVSTLCLVVLFLSSVWMYPSLISSSVLFPEAETASPATTQQHLQSHQNTPSRTEVAITAPAASALALQFPKIAKLTAASGSVTGQYERAIEGHRLHAEMHGYAWHVLRENIVDGPWVKVPFMMSVVLNEMRKPVEERVEWFLYVPRSA